MLKYGSNFGVKMGPTFTQFSDSAAVSLHLSKTLNYVNETMHKQRDIRDITHSIDDCLYVQQQQQ